MSGESRAERAAGNGGDAPALPRRMEFRGARYLGGHPSRPHADKTRFFYLTPTGIEFRTGMTPVAIPWESVTGVVVVGAEEIESRLAGGPVPTDRLTTSNGTVSYMLVESGHGAPVFEMAGVSTEELRAALGPLDWRLVPEEQRVELEFTELSPEDVDLNTSQMTAFGIDDLVKKGPEEDSATSEDEVEPAAEVEAEVEPEAVAEPEPEPEPEVVAEAEPELEPEPEAVAEVEPDVVAESEPWVAAEPEPEPEPEAVAEVEDLAEAEPAPLVFAEVEPEAISEREPELQLIAEAEPEPDVIVEAEELLLAEPEPVAVLEDQSGAQDDTEEIELPAVADLQLIAETEPEPQAEAETQVEGVEEAEPAQDTPSESEQVVGADAEARPYDQDMVEPDPEPLLEVIGAAEAGSEVEDETPFELDPEPEPEPEPEPVPIECSDGHTNPAGTKFCLRCGESLMVLACPNGHENPEGASFCGECGSGLEPAGPRSARGTDHITEETPTVESLGRVLAEASATFRTMQAAQDAELGPRINLLSKQGSGDANEQPVPEERVLQLRKALHEQHLVVKRTELALAEAQGDGADASEAEIAEALIELRRAELDFAIQMLLEVTELIALPRNDEEGKTLVREHMKGIFRECDDTRMAAALRHAKARGESHAIRAAELEIEVTAKQRELDERRDDETLAAADLWQMAGGVLALRVTQLEERRAGAIARGDLEGTDDTEVSLHRARAELQAHEEQAPRWASSPKVTEMVEEMHKLMPTVFAGGERVPRTTDRRVSVAKRAVSEFSAYFMDNPAPKSGVSGKLATALNDEWDEYNVASRRLMGIPMAVQGRSLTRTKVQWIKNDQLIINAWTRRVILVATEIELAEQAGDTVRAEALRTLHQTATEALKHNSQAAKVEVPAV